VGEKNLVREDENEESGGWIEEREKEKRMEKVVRDREGVWI
jgi:hypothetical protein